MNVKERNTYLDLTRVIAVVAVVTIHISGWFVAYFAPSSTEFLWGNIFDGISCMAVPIFVMISGALMLDEDRQVDTRQLYTKNIKALVGPLIFWSVLYCGVYTILIPIAEGQTVELWTIGYSLLAGHYHMWYLYMIIGLYLITPFLRKFVSKENKNLVLLFIGLSLAAQFTIPILNGLTKIYDRAVWLISWIEKFQLGFVGGYTVYYLLGWYLTHIGVKRKRRLYCLGALSLVATILYVQVTQDDSSGYSAKSVCNLLYSAALFTALTQGKGHSFRNGTKKLLETLSKLSFGVYIIHPLWITAVGKCYQYSGGPLLYILCDTVIIVILSFATCYGLSKIPVVKKIVRL